MVNYSCRACAQSSGAVVLDLGSQPACDFFPPADSSVNDPRYRLQMWLCDTCQLAQLMQDETTPEEPRGIEPAALVQQARAAINTVSKAGLLNCGATVIEYGSPHGGSWLPMLAERGLIPAVSDEAADVVLDCFGMMHCADQAAAVRERAERLSNTGVLLIQYHSLAAIIQHHQWNALRHGHFGYYSARALQAMLAAVGLTPISAWRFDLYGGTVLLAASRNGQPDTTFHELLAWEDRMDPYSTEGVGRLQNAAKVATRSFRKWLVDNSTTPVYGYGAASRTIPLLCAANIDVDLLVAIADAAPTKWGRRMPGTQIPIISPEQLIAVDPASVLLFLPDLLNEVQAAFPSLNGRWKIAEQVYG